MNTLKTLFTREFRKSADEIESALCGSTARGTVSSITHNYAGSYVLALCEGGSARSSHPRYASAIFVRRHCGEGTSRGHELLWAVTAPEHRGRGCAAALFRILLRICANDNAHALLIASTRKAVGFWLKLGLADVGDSGLKFARIVVRDNPEKALAHGIEPKRRAAALQQAIKAVDIESDLPEYLSLGPIHPRFDKTQTSQLVWVNGM